MDVKSPEFEAAFVRDLRALQILYGDKVLLELPVALAVTLVGQLQLALRHPANVGPPAKKTRRLVRSLIGLLGAGSKVIRRGLEAGNNPAFDLPGSGG